MNPAIVLQQSGKQQYQPKPIDVAGWPLKFPAKEHCSKCGLCETSFVQNVTTACAFLPTLGMQRLHDLEQKVHGRSRCLSDIEYSDVKKRQSTTEVDEARFGVLYEPIRLVRGINMPDAQWTGVVTSIAVAMLEAKIVDAVVCIANSENKTSTWNNPEPMIAKTINDVLRGRGVKPALAPSLNVIDTIKNDSTIRKLLFCGVGCAVQAFRAIQSDLQLDEVYVLGTNCVDNSPTPEAAELFIRNGVLRSDDIPSSDIKGYEFMQDYKVHVKTTNSYITKPYFTLPGTIAEQAIAKSCLTCMDYTNAVADVVIGYMGAPLIAGQRMDESYQTLSIRNECGNKMVQTAIAAGRLEIGPMASGKGNHEPLVIATINSDAIVQGMIDKTQVKTTGMPLWLGEIFAYLLRSTGPTGLNFAKYSIDYHILRNYLYILNTKERKQKTGLAEQQSLPQYVHDLVEYYKTNYKEFRDLVQKIKQQQQEQNLL